MSPEKPAIPLSHHHAVFRLTALWALCESGLGGWMHALGLPFTGFFVGGFAVIIISLIANFSGNSPRQVLQATALVIAIKAAVSPQSPPPAYIAVAFQGVTGALFFKLLPFRVAAIVFPVIAMMESAWQKLLVATIVYGKALWQAIDMLFQGILKDFHLPGNISYSAGIIVLYSAMYAIWGVVLGLWIIKLPAQIEARAGAIRQHLPTPTDNTTMAKKKGNAKSKLLYALVLLGFILIVFFLSKEQLGKAGYVVLRTFAVIAFLMLVINPLFRWLMAQWLKRTRSKQAEKLGAVTNILPELRSYIQPAYQLAAQKHSGLKRYRMFVLTLIVLTLYPANREQ